MSVLPGVREAALVGIEVLIDQHPQVTKAHYLRGANLQALERVEAVIVSYLRAAKTDPGCLPALTRLAELFATKGDGPRTGEFVERARQIEQDPGRRQALRDLLAGPPPGEG